MRARKRRIPYSGGFELTPLCNFNCKMCYVHLTKDQMNCEQQLLSTETWIDIMRQAIDAGMMYADLTGGECLTYPGFQEVYLYLLSRGIHVSILTNGYLLTEEMIEFMMKYRPTTIQVSVYGSSREAYRRVTGQDAFDTVMKNLECLKRSGIMAKVAIMPHRYMSEDVQGLLDLIHDLDMDYTIGDVNLPPRENTGRCLEDYVADEELAVRLKLSDMRYRTEHGTLGTYIPPYYFSVKDAETEGGVPCASGRCSFHVNWKGDLTPCIPFDKVNKSVLSEGFVAAWNDIGKQMEAYRTPKECQLCDLRNKCAVCPGEKTFGILNGPLNTVVCRRLRRMLEAEQ